MSVQIEEYLINGQFLEEKHDKVITGLVYTLHMPQKLLLSLIIFGRALE